jgi:hypothetical protein
MSAASPASMLVRVSPVSDFAITLSVPWVPVTTTGSV